MSDDNKHDGHKEHKHHLVPIKHYFFVWIGLLILTIVTVLASYVDFGSANVLIAFLIATVKALLVLMIFMGLYYDGKESSVTFFASFLFLAIFILFTSLDETTRPPTRLALVDPSEMPSDGTSTVDISGVVKSTPEILQKGAALFVQNCVTCHGGEGKGDGPAAAALSPKPRNFHATEGWKNGRTLSAVYKTLAEGIPGSPMPSFASLPAEDRMALVHYIRTLMPNPPATTDSEISTLVKSAGGSSKPRVTLATAMEAMISESDPEVKDHLRSTNGSGKMISTATGGAKLYAQNCLSCHATGGRGGIEVTATGVNPVLRFVTKPLRNVGSFQEFQRSVEEGIPGSGMPGFSQFTQREWQELYNYVRAL
ncbi:MAG: c-type cytochrome [Bacteriovoracia bacterium]